MNHKQLISLTICFILPGVFGFTVQTFAANESSADQTAEQHFEKANELYDAGDYDGAVAEYERITNLSPNSRIAQNAQYWMGQSQFKAGRLDAALASFHGLIDEYPTSAIIPATQLMIGRVEQSKEEKSLVDAIKKGDVEELKSLISKGVDVNARIKADVEDDGNVREGWTLLNLSIRLRKADVATFLINQGADVNERNTCYLRKFPLNYVAHFGTAALAKLLIAKGADVNVKEDGGWTPLHNVTSDLNPDPNDDLEVARLLISNGADIEAENDWHNRPLHLAALHGQYDLVKLLISKGANIEARGEKKQTPLHLAVRNGQLDLVKLLISNGADIEAENDWTRPLHLAALNGQLDIVKLLISKGANIEARSHRYTPLHAAVLGAKNTEARDERLEIVKLLLDKGAYIDSKDGIDHTPLAYAIFKGNEDMVELLLARGAARWHRVMNLDYVGYAMWRHQKKMVKFLIDKGFKYSPVHVAAFFGDLDTIKSYLAGGGNIDALDPSSLPLLACAIAGGSTEVAKFLINEGADIQAKSLPGADALICAVMTGGSEGHPEIVRMLLDRGADVTIRGGSDVGRTALLWAVCMGQKDIVEMILAKGADVNARSDRSFSMSIEDVTALHEACMAGRTAMAEVLIAHGADVNAKTKDGKTPMDFAKSRGHEEIIELLRKHGAKG